MGSEMQELLIEARDGGSQLGVKATPRGSSNALKGVRAGELLISVTAPPDAGAANEAIIALLAKTLRVGKSCIEIKRGHSSRSKSVWFALEPEDLRDKLSAAKK